MNREAIRSDIVAVDAPHAVEEKKALDVLGLFTRGKSQLRLALTTLFVLLLVASSVCTVSYTYVETSDGALHAAWQMMKVTNGGIYKDVVRYMAMGQRTTGFAELFVRRCDEYRQTPPGSDWSGVTYMKEK